MRFGTPEIPFRLVFAYWTNIKGKRGNCSVVYDLQSIEGVCPLLLNAPRYGALDKVWMIHDDGSPKTPLIKSPKPW